MRSFVVCLVSSLVLCGCGIRRAQHVGPADALTRSTPDSAQPPAEDSLQTFVGKMRELAAGARPRTTTGETIEGIDVRLGAALAAAAIKPSPSAFREVASEYRRLGVADRALEYLHRARALDPHDGATHDALARMWRDSGFPHLALGDAYRAVYHAPLSAGARNTLGTVFQALGQQSAARMQFERATALDPSAVYALNNLCYSWILEGDQQKAATACLAALQVEPGFAAARNNLALSYAAAGDVAAARDAFDAAGDRAGALYNIGIVHLARRQYPDAVTAFREAQMIRPGLRLAEARARQAESLMHMGGE